MKRKAISCLLVLASVLTMTPTIPTLAAENQADKTVVNETLADENYADKTLTDETQTGGTSTDGLQETNASGSKAAVVKYDQASSFTVTIPKSIVLGSNKTATYNVKVKGDILGNEIITVVPDATVTLNDANGKDSVTGNIDQEKTEFSSTEVDTNSGNTTGSVLANDLTSGDWSGNFKFVIGTNQIGNGTTITSENLATYGIETTGDVVIPEYVTDDDNTRHAVTSIGDYAFRDCNEMTSITIAESVTEIGTGAFVNCSKLSRAAVPNSVRSIGNSAFDGCTSLSSISYNGNEYDLSNIEPAFVENGVSVGSHVFEHSYSAPVYTWSEDNSTCTATKTCSECHDIITETVNVSTKTTDSTCTDEGLNAYTATFKNSDFETQTKTSKISAKGHKSVSANNAVAATCTTDGKESDTVCSVCGVTLTTGKTITKTGHKYGTPTYTWSEDKATCTAARTCSVCSDEQTETVNATSKVTKAATCTGTGVTTYTAKFTNTAFATQTTTSSISAVGHKSVSANNAVAATCTTDGKESDTVCSVCGVTLATGKTITKTGHKYGTPTYTWSNDGKTCVAKRVCANDSTHIETENGTITNKVKTAATCTAKGTRTYTATFKNTAFKTQTKDVQDIAALGHSYSSEYTIDTAATCTADGSKSQHCTRSGCTAKQNVTVITKTGHKYGTPTYTWSNDGKTCVAKRVCANDSTHIETENGTITNKVKTAATCTVKGTRTYTATFKNTAFKTQTKDVQDIAALGHKYGTPTYTWSEDGQTCTAKRVCTNNASHIETEEATITHSVKTEATCLQKGTTNYTATFKNSSFNTQTKDVQDIAVSNHNYVNNVCTVCNAKEPGLYDANDVMLCSWEESGIDVTQNYGSASGENPYTTTPTSGYYVLTNNYPTATKVVIPSGITNIGSNAFGHYANLTSVVIPDTVTNIGTWAFQMNGITSIDIPDSVTSIGRGAFYKCNNLTSVTMPSKITNISERLFDSCTSLQNVSIPENVTSIGYSAFLNTALTSITIPDNVKTVDYNAFKDCTSLKRVSIGSGMESMSSGVFYGDTVLTNVTFNNCNKLTEIGKIYPDTTRYYYGVFQDCVSLQNVKIPESVTTIGDYTFNGCTSLDSVTYKGMDYDDSIDFELSLKTNNIETGNSVFVKSGISYTVLGLTNSYLSTCKIPSSGDIVIPKHVTGEDGIKYRIIRIGDGAFRDCTELTSVVIPDSVIAIGNAAFEYCSKLTIIIIPNSVTSIGWNSFNGCSELTNITIPNSVTSIGDNAFSNCVKLSSINIPDNITNINRGAFSGCSNLSTVTYKGSVYKSKLELESALTSNGVTIGSDVFADTALN